MADTLPMLENDPRGSYRFSRQLRLLAFCLVASIVLVSVLIVAVRFLYDNYVADFFGLAPYNSQPIFVIPAMFVIAAFLAKILWDAAEGRAERRRTK